MSRRYWTTSPRSACVISARACHGPIGTPKPGASGTTGCFRPWPRAWNSCPARSIRRRRSPLSPALRRRHACPSTTPISSPRCSRATASAQADRIYWFSARDLDPDLPTEDGPHMDVRHYHMGLRRADGTPKLLYRLLCEGGMEQVRLVLHQAGRSGVRRKPARRDDTVLITGGAGCIGSNLAHRLLSQGRPGRILDNLSRPGSEKNLHWLAQQHPEDLDFVLGDVRNRMVVRTALKGVSEMFHFAAQVAVTTSLDAPVFDSEVNIGGTLTVLEELRRLSQPPGLVFFSTNKVYGGLVQLELELNGRRFVFF